MSYQPNPVSNQEESKRTFVLVAYIADLLRAQYLAAVPFRKKHVAF